MPVINIYSQPSAHHHGAFTIENCNRETPLHDFKPELSAMIIAKVHEDTGFTHDAIELGVLKNSYVWLDDRSTTLSNLFEEAKILEDQVTLLIQIMEPTRFRQLIEKKRAMLWETYGTELTRMFPDNIFEKG